MRRVQIIANPAAGQGSFDIKALNDQFLAAGIDWDVKFTKEWQDGTRLAKAALDEGVDAIAVYGGDGTVADVAGGLVGSDVPMAILPGGTANVMSVELGIPPAFASALQVIAAPQWTTRPVDLGVVDGHYFMLRLSMGLEARMVAGADRMLKDRLGTLAYALSALQALREPEVVRYQFELDGVAVEEEGIACVIANSANLGLSGVQLAPNVDISDGLLDVFVINTATLPTVVTLLAGIFGRDEVEIVEEPATASADRSDLRTVRHWQAKRIAVATAPVSQVQCDGEMIGVTPKQIEMVPRSVNVMVPSPVDGLNG